MFGRKGKEQQTVTLPEPVGFFSTDNSLTVSQKVNVNPLAQSIRVLPPAVEGEAMDDANTASSLKWGLTNPGIPDAQLNWYAGQGFIGYNVCAVMAQHWLVNKACAMPGRDAVRQGWDINVDDESVDADEIAKMLKHCDKQMKVSKSMAEFIHMGRVFGIRVAIFMVDSTDPEYYEKPFNPDGVEPGSYRGISQVDPIWCVPELTSATLAEPQNLHFYEPTFWRIGGKRYHRSHLCVYVPFPVADILKPTYLYGGVSVPQRIYERVYAAERTSNEAPQLAMTKRLTVLKVNAAKFLANMEQATANLLAWCGLRDNYGVKVVDKESEDLTQFDTGLADLDATIMTQYQLVAAIASVPATKLLGTSPKGFGASGEYEESNYREELESIQANDLAHMLERHHLLCMRSYVAPKLGITPVKTTVVWSPLDSPTAAEWATILKTRAETDNLYVQMGAIDGMDVREKIRADKDGDYHALAEIEETEELPEEPVEAAPNGQA